LRIGIARGRSYASVLIIPRKKMRLFEAPHGRRPWPDFKLHGRSWELTGEGKENGKERRGRGRGLGVLQGGAMVRMGGWQGVGSSVLVSLLYCSLPEAAVPEEGSRNQGGRRREEKKRKEGKEKKRKKGKKIRKNF
jgi:hypothetical protein